jgi:acyl carrier protein
MTNNRATDEAPPRASDAHQEMLAVVRASIERVAPDVDAATIPTDVDFRDEVELDSMDFLAVLTTIQERTGVSIPELHYPDVGTLDSLAQYLVDHAEQ